jgi:soluble lytic murein transglycosylase
MPIPTQTTFGVGQTAAPDVNLTAPGGPNAEQIVGAQTEAAGRAMQGAGDAASKIALAVQDQVNQTRVNDAVNQARIASQNLTYDPAQGYRALRGNDALTRPSGQPLADEYSDKLRSALSDIAGGLGNEAQRRAFAMSSSGLQAQFKGEVEAHTLQQFEAYHDSVNDATVALAKDGIAQHWDDPDYIYGHTGPNGDRVPGAIEAIKAATMARAQQHGLEGAPADAAILDATSSAHRAVVQAALENNNAAYALSYMEAARKRGEMNGTDILALQGHVNQNVWMNVSAAAVGSATSEAARVFAPTPLDRFATITMGTESNGRDFNADGTPVVSPAGAKYKMQVMPATAADPGHGIKPAANDSPAEYNRVGQQLLAAMLQKYGDPAKAWAAYNAGDKTVDKAIADAESVGDPGLWLEAMGGHQSEKNHAETVDYVKKNMAALNDPTAARASRPTELEFVNAALAKLPANAAPQLVQMTRQHAGQQFSVIEKSFKEKGEQALGAAQQWLYANQGAGATVADIPQPIMDDVLRYAPGDAGRPLEAFSKALQRGDTVTNLGRYNDIVSNRGAYFQMSDPAWNMLQTELSSSTFQQLTKQRAEWKNGTGDDSPNGMDHATIARVLNERLSSLQLPTTAKPNTKEGAWLGATKLFVDQQVLQAQRASGKRMTPADVETFMDKLFAANVEFKRTLFGMDFNSTQHNLIGMQIDELSSDTIASVKKALQKNGRANPSDADVLNTYRIMRLGQQ